MVFPKRLNLCNKCDGFIHFCSVNGRSNLIFCPCGLIARINKDEITHAEVTLCLFRHPGIHVLCFVFFFFTQPAEEFAESGFNDYIFNASSLINKPQAKRKRAPLLQASGDALKESVEESFTGLSLKIRITSTLKRAFKIQPMRTTSNLSSKNDLFDVMKWFHSRYTKVNLWKVKKRKCKSILQNKQHSADSASVLFKMSSLCFYRLQPPDMFHCGIQLLCPRRVIGDPYCGECTHWNRTLTPALRPDVLCIHVLCAFPASCSRASVFSVWLICQCCWIYLLNYSVCHARLLIMWTRLNAEHNFIIPLIRRSGFKN